MSKQKHAEVRKAADGLRKKDDISLVDVLTLAEASIHSMKSFIDSLDSTIYSEFREIAEYIQNTKVEIGHLPANDLRSKHIPEAGNELSAVVSSTEEATTKIMECAEAVLDGDTSDIEAYQQMVSDKMMIIFEACSFQDITGQRVNKVVKSITYVEQRIDALVNLWGKEQLAEVEVPVDREKTPDEQFLSGPQLAGNGLSQDDIDNLFD